MNNAILLVDPGEPSASAGMPRPRRCERPGAGLALYPDDHLDDRPGPAPVALGIGEGADAQAPLARAVVGGSLGSMVITPLSDSGGLFLA